MRTTRLPVLLCALAVCLAAAPLAHAGEDVRAAVSFPAGQPVPLVTANGNGLAQGSFAVGTIQLEYSYVGFTFPVGPFASFDLDLETIQKNGPDTQYPAPLDLTQSGSSNLVLTATPNHFDLTAYPWSNTSIVDIAIPQSVLEDPALSEDGAVIVGNLQLKTSARSKLGTTTSIQVKIRLVHPTACLKQYTFLSDRDITTEYTSAVIRYKASNGKIQNSSPNLNSVAQVVLLVNTCGDDRTVDLRVTPDARFGFGSGGGNTTFVYSTDGELAPGAIDLSTLDQGDTYKSALTIEDLTIAAGKTVLVKLHLVFDSTLTKDSIGSSPFTFASAAYETGGTFTTLDTETNPNPATADVPFTLQSQN